LRLCGEYIGQPVAQAVAPAAKAAGVPGTLSGALFDDNDGAVPRAYLVFSREAGQPAFNSKDALRFQQLLPHLRKAMAAYWKSLQDNLNSQANESAVERMGHGIALLGQDGKVIYSSPRAACVFQAADGLTLREGRIAVHRDDSAALQQLVDKALDGVAGSLMVQRLSSNPAYTLVAWPLVEPGHFARLSGLPAAAVLILDPVQCQPAQGLCAFARAYRLTAAEVRVLELILQNRSPKQIASQLNLGLSTVRSQLSSIFEKTGSRTQRELIARFLRATTAY
jgi:DNA-binding CsgD family transcriptional regulator